MNVESENKNSIGRYASETLRGRVPPRGRILTLKAILLVVIMIIGITALAIPAVPNAHAAAGTSFDNIVIVAMENQNYASVMATGTGSTSAPFIASMLAQSSTIPNYHGYGAAGRSINGCSAGCYTALISGSDQGISDGYSCCINAPTLVDKMTTAGLTWQAYCESGCPRGNDHFPFTGFTTTSTSPNIFTGGSVSIADFVAAANSASPPNLLWFTPTDNHNMHDNSVQTGDSYLHNFLVGSTGSLASPASGSLLASNLFKPGHRTMLLLWWDEYDPAPILFYGTMIKQAFISTSNVYDEFSILHLFENNWALSTLTSNDAAASPMSEIYGTTTPPPLTTSFTVSPSTPVINLPVTFAATTTGGASPYTISWNFGDGTTGTGASLTHVFSTLASFTVTETATDSSSPSQTATSSKSVTIANPPPLTTSFTYLPSSPVVNSPVTFAAAPTGGTAPYTINWNFGDGATGTGLTATHTFTTTQSFAVTETATDTSTPTQTATSAQTIPVFASLPLSTSFTFLPSSPTVNSPVFFTAVTTGGTLPYTTSWSFGDGAAATGLTAAHTYTTAQSFTVTETATDSSSPQKTATATHSVVVSSSLTGNFDNTWFINNCPGGTETISNGVLQTRQSTPGGGSNSYGYCTGQRGSFPWGSTVGTALPSGITSVTVSFNFLSRSLLSGSRYHLYVALYYQIPSSTSGGTTYSWLDTQSRVENVGGTDSPIGSTATYDPGDSFGWDIVTLQVNPGQTGVITADATQLCQGDLAAWGLPANTQCTLKGIEIGTEGYLVNSVNVDWYNVGLNIGSIPLSTSFTVSPGTPLVNKPVTFTSTTTGGTSPYTITWSFGDGSTGTGATVTHTYSTAQSFTVTETGSDSSSPSQTATSSKSVTVSPPPPLSTTFTFLPSAPLVNTPEVFTATTTGGASPYTIAWNFGDGSTGTGTSITHTYSTAQTFTVTETATDASSPSQTTTSSRTVTTSTPPPPSTSFTSSPNNPRVNSVVTFTSTTTGGTSPYSITWTFGDGGSATGAIVTHTFTSAQTFTVTETATDSSSPSQTATGSKMVTVSPPPPLSTGFTFLPATPLVNTPVTFTAVTTSGTSPYTISWNFGDGSTSIGPTVTHTFTTAQSFTVTETATDSSSPTQTATSSHPLTVYTIPPLSAAIRASPSSSQVGQTVSFTASATGGTSPYSYAISFGDGAIGTGRSPTHTYSAAGSYTVTLTATDSASPQGNSLASIVVYVQALLPPALALPSNKTATSESWINFTVTATSSDPTRIVTLSTSQLPLGATFDSSSGVFSWKPSASQTGYYTITFIATDDSTPPMSGTSPMGIQVNQAAPGGSGGGGSGGGSNGGCTSCLTLPAISNSMWLLMIGGLLGLVTSLALLTIKARASLEHTKRRLTRMRRDD